MRKKEEGTRSLRMSSDSHVDTEKKKKILMLATNTWSGVCGSGQGLRVGVRGQRFGFGGWVAG